MEAFILADRLIYELNAIKSQLQQQKSVLLPICYRNHWVYLRFDVTQGIVESEMKVIISYSDGIGTKHDAKFCELSIEVFAQHFVNMILNKTILQDSASNISEIQEIDRPYKLQFEFRDQTNLDTYINLLCYKVLQENFTPEESLKLYKNHEIMQAIFPDEAQLVSFIRYLLVVKKRMLISGKSNEELICLMHDEIQNIIAIQPNALEICGGVAALLLDGKQDPSLSQVYKKIYDIAKTVMLGYATLSLAQSREIAFNYLFSHAVDNSIASQALTNLQSSRCRLFGTQEGQRLLNVCNQSFKFSQDDCLPKSSQIPRTRSRSF